MKKVTIIRERRGLSLVEWLDEKNIKQRNWVKGTSLIDRLGKTAMVEEPQQGMPEGVPFEHLLQPSVTGHDICRELRQRGLWTAADLQAHPQSVMGALQAAYGLDLAQVIRVARAYEKTMEE